jgi:hypothetical protein
MPSVVGPQLDPSHGVPSSWLRYGTLSRRTPGPATAGYARGNSSVDGEVAGMRLHASTHPSPGGRDRPSPGYRTFSRTLGLAPNSSTKLLCGRSVSFDAEPLGADHSVVESQFLTQCADMSASTSTARPSATSRVDAGSTSDADPGVSASGRKSPRFAPDGEVDNSSPLSDAAAMPGTSGARTKVSARGPSPLIEMLRTTRIAATTREENEIFHKRYSPSLIRRFGLLGPALFYYRAIGRAGCVFSGH